MKLRDIEERLDGAAIEIEKFMERNTAEKWDVEVTFDDCFYIKVYGPLEFAEVRSDEWGDYVVEIKSRGFMLEDELIDFIYELQL